MGSSWIRSNGKAVARIKLGEIGRGLSPYPFVLSYPQDDHERLLVEQLHALGGEVEWNTELTTLSQSPDAVQTVISAPAGDIQDDFSYVCGCDGGRSTVRHQLGIDFSGGTYEQRFFVADVAAHGDAANGEVNLCFGPNVFCAVFPVRSTGHCRVIGILPAETSDKNDLTYDDMRPIIARLSRLSVDSVQWFSTYQVHHRVAERFARGRVFLAGDAAHVHSPAGGQGMNTGVGDAVNLAWKLAAVLAQGIDPELLDTYEAERIRFARLLVGSTDLAFTSIVTGWRGRMMRTIVFPLLAPVATRFKAFRRLVFRTLSQTRIEYRHSPLSVGRCAGVLPGDRLPWVADLDNFAPLQSCAWQAHVYGDIDPALAQLLQVMSTPIHRFPWTPAAQHAQLQRDAVYMVRPDGYIGCVQSAGGEDVLTPYLEQYVTARQEWTAEVFA